ncbi:GNAT family N-acetyltransferase [Microlunatus flavus]|uniref:GNAT family N-acetyltransferase n=1 Tax=Microlunatus flavus TaxID=1036181 RepID=UPI0018E075C8|nr:GNAT family N-acetyltransferase [Microlunatus flavus]
MRPTPLPWPAVPPASGTVVLRRFTSADVGMLRDLATDPYVPLIGSLPHRADEVQALAYVERQLSRPEQGVGWSFCVADGVSDEALGGAGLWLVPDDPRVLTAGYSVAPRARGRGVATQALRALVGFAWTRPHVERVELRVEPDNAASLRVAAAAGFERDGLERGREFRGRAVDLVRFVLRRPAG